jgi:hypothetical protein
MPLGTRISSRSAFKDAVLIYNRCMSHLKSTARAISVLNIVVVLEVGENLAQKSTSYCCSCYLATSCAL